MAGRARSIATSGILAVLLASGCSVQPSTTALEQGLAPSAVAVSAVESGPAVVDSGNRALSVEHADVVRAVDEALAAGDLDELRGLYVGDDWATQATLLAQPQVRDQVRQALRTPPANLGEGYVYGERGYQAGFFLDYDPPRRTSGDLQWRGIEVAPAGTTAA